MHINDIENDAVRGAIYGAVGCTAACLLIGTGALIAGGIGAIVTTAIVVCAALGAFVNTI
jgi:hypothetical protein